MFMGVNSEEDNNSGSWEGDDDEEDMDYAEKENQVNATVNALTAIEKKPTTVLLMMVKCEVLERGKLKQKM
jgi:hypothetical protein